MLYLQYKRGTATSLDQYTGKKGEMAIDTTNNAIRVFDGETQGGAVANTEMKIFTQQNTTSTNLAVNLNQGRFVRLTLEGSVDISFDNVNTADQVILWLTQDGVGGRTVTWPVGTLWPHGQELNLSTEPGSTDVVQLITYDGGGNWFASMAGADFR